MKLEIEITRQDYMDFNVYHFIKARLGSTLIIGIGGLIILQFAINKDKSSIDINLMIVSSLIYIVIYCILLYYSFNRSKKIPDENGAILGKKEFEFSADFISYRDKDSAGQYNWTAIKRLKESKKAFYLYIDTNMAILIPKRYFNNKIEEREFNAYIQNKLTIA